MNAKIHKNRSGILKRLAFLHWRKEPSGSPLVCTAMAILETRPFIEENSFGPRDLEAVLRQGSRWNLIPGE